MAFASGKQSVEGREPDEHRFQLNGQVDVPVHGRVATCWTGRRARGWVHVPWLGGRGLGRRLPEAERPASRESRCRSGFLAYGPGVYPRKELVAADGASPRFPLFLDGWGWGPGASLAGLRWASPPSEVRRSPVC